MSLTDKQLDQLSERTSIQIVGDVPFVTIPDRIMGELIVQAKRANALQAQLDKLWTDRELKDLRDAEKCL